MIALGAVHSFVLAPSLRASAVHAMPKHINMAMHLDEAALASVFHKVDKDHSGWLDKAELKNAYELAGLPMSDAEIERSFKMIDVNGDGKIDLDEFFNIAKQSESHDLIQMFGQIAARDAGHNLELNDEPQVHVSLRDQRMAKENTRKFCLDRCLATGHCDALEDLLAMTTMQVKKFCDQCGSTDECILDPA